MRAVIQRVSFAEVLVPATGYRRAISRGLLILLGIEKGDTPEELRWAAEKCVHLRVFPDADGKMNLSLKDCGGAALVVSQFTLLGECRRGRRPGFERAAAPGEAAALYELFCAELAQNYGVPVERGVFQSTMQVSLVNDGPVTLLLERSRKEG